MKKTERSVQNAGNGVFWKLSIGKQWGGAFYTDQIPLPPLEGGIASITHIISLLTSYFSPLALNTC